MALSICSNMQMGFRLRPQMPHRSGVPTSSAQTRHASLLRRPLRPYTFTQLVTLSDGSAYLQRSTSPIPVMSSQKDARNVALWNPSNRKLAYMEDDGAGRLRKFRSRYGRAWDTERGENDAESESLSSLMESYAETAPPTAHSGGKSKK